MKEAPRSIAKALLLPINPAAIIILGVYTIVWGLWLINPFWTVFTQAALYSDLARLAPEAFWGALAIACGSATTYGAVTRTYRPLIFGAVVAGWHWFMISVLYFMGDWHNTGGITALAFAIYAAFVYLNIRTNYKDKRSDIGIHGP